MLIVPHVIYRGIVTLNYNIQYPSEIGVVGNNNSSYYLLLLVISDGQKTGWYDEYLSDGSITSASSVGRYFCC